MGRAFRIRLLVGCCLVGLLGFGADAHAFTFGPLVSQTGPQWTVFDWPTQHCETWDIPDQPARAFKDDQGNVQLIASHGAVRREIGPDLNSVRHQCAVLYMPIQDPDPSHFDDLLWPSGLYTLDGKTIYALAHTEYRGFNHNNCPIDPSASFSETAKCWYNAITLMKSTNSGATYTHTAAPTHLVAAAPDIYVAGTGPDGVFTPSNIVYRQSDGYYYTLVRATKTPGGQGGTCVMRSQTLSDPKSWRAWDGNAFALRFINPYIESGSPRSEHMCAFVSPSEIQSSTESLTWNNHYQRYMLVGAASPSGQPPGFYFSLSEDLIHWTPRRLLMAANVPWLPNCGDPDPVRDPSVLDPASTSRNFETAGQTANLYFIQLHVTSPSGFHCYWPEHRDLMAIPIRFSGAPPVASFTASPNPALVGQAVKLDASASSDPNGSIVKYEWDLDGNGVFETSSGSNPVLSTSFSEVPSRDVGLRVTDNEDLADYYYTSVTVVRRPVAPPTFASTVPSSPANDNNPKVKGSAEANSTVKLYTNASCSGSPVATGSAAGFASPGLPVSVPDNSTTTFHGTATDAASQVSGCSASSITYVEDSTAPETFVDSGPPGATNDSTPTFTFSSNEPQTTFMCRLDGPGPTAGSPASCTSPTTFTLLGDGAYTFFVQATDVANNIDQTSATRSYSVDTAAPNTLISSGPQGLTNSTSATFTFSSTEAGSTFECRLDGAAFASCTSPASYGPLTDGSHTFRVRAIDQAGNSDVTEAMSTWTINTNPPDTVPPDTTIIAGPPDQTESASATFQFGATEAGSSFACQLDAGGWISCSSPITYSGLSEGVHTFYVRATDSAANTDQSPAAQSWTIRAIPPTPASPQPLSGFGSAAGALDTTPPSIALLGKSPQEAVRQGGIALDVTCLTEACTASANGALSSGGATRAIKLRPATAQIQKGAKARLKLRFTRKATRAVKQAFKKRRRVNAYLTVSVKDLAGNVTLARRVVRLKK